MKKRACQFTLSGIFAVATLLCCSLAVWHYYLMNVITPWQRIEIAASVPVSKSLLRTIEKVDGVTSIELDAEVLIVETRSPKASLETLLLLRDNGLNTRSFWTSQNESMVRLLEDQMRHRIHPTLNKHRSNPRLYLRIPPPSSEE